MRALLRFVIMAVPVAALLGCGGGTKVMVPPRIDLEEHEVLAIIEIESNNEGELGPMATQRFIEMIRLDQGLVPIVELGTEDQVLEDLNGSRLNPATYKALGEKYGVATIFAGELEVSEVRPVISFTDFKNMGAAADVDATLTVRMVDTVSGASIWSRSGSVTKRVGQVGVFGGKDIVFDAEDPDGAYGELVVRRE
jgi:hypothetical protein